jgi:hypothetical protein
MAEGIDEGLSDRLRLGASTRHNGRFEDCFTPTINTPSIRGGSNRQRLHFDIKFQCPANFAT